MKRNVFNIRNSKIILIIHVIAVLFLIINSYKDNIILKLVIFVYLTFIPGIILLNILKIQDLDFTELLLFSAGLSVSFLMLFGLLINFVYPIFGVDKPISREYLAVTMICFLTLITIFQYVFVKETSCIFFNFNLNYQLPWFLLPCLSVLGVLFIYYYNNNILLILLLIVISIIPLLIDRLNKNIYPLVIWSISITLLFHSSLISQYVWGADIHHEMFISNLVKSEGVWNPLIPDNYNSVLSLTILAPIYSNILNMELTWVFKIIYPLIFSFVPVGLYKLFSSQIEDKTAFLSTFFFMSVWTFYTEMLALARQQIAELFLILVIILLIIKNNNSNLNIKFLTLVFSISIIISHYGISYWLMVSLIFVYIILMYLNFNQIGFSYILLYIVYVFGWYIYVSGGVTFEQLVLLGNNILINLEELANPKYSEGVDIILKPRLFLDRVLVFLNVLSQFFISVGVISLIYRLSKGNNTPKFNGKYISFTITSFVWMIAGVVVSNLTYGGFGATRLYHIGLFILSPFFVIGFRQVMGIFATNVKTEAIISIFLLIFLLFNTGVIKEIAGYEFSSGPLSFAHDWEKSKDIVSKAKFYNWYTLSCDVVGATWLGENRGNLHIYADMFRCRVLESYGHISGDDLIVLLNKTRRYPSDFYIFLGTFNNNEKIITFTEPYGRVLKLWNISEPFPDLYVNKIRIYTNKNCSIYMNNL